MGFLTQAFSSPLFGLGVAGLSAGAETSATYYDVKAQNLAAEWSAASDRTQSQLERVRAANFRQLGDIEYADTLRQYDTLRGQARAQYGASGVAVNAGSAADVQADIAAEGNYEAQKSRYARALQAWEADQSANRYEFEAQLKLANKRDPRVPAARSALTGLTNMYSMFGNTNM